MQKAGRFEEMSKGQRNYINGSLISRMQLTWETRLAELETFKNEHGHCNVTQRSGKLGKWVINVRSSQTRGELPQERKYVLDDIGFRWQVKINCAHEGCTKQTRKGELCFRHRGRMFS